MVNYEVLFAPNLSVCLLVFLSCVIKLTVVSYYYITTKIPKNYHFLCLNYRIIKLSISKLNKQNIESFVVSQFVNKLL